MKEGQQYPHWLRGSFPQWLVVGLLTVIGWGLKNAYDDFKATIAKSVDELHSQDIRISVLEDWRNRNAGGVR
jgi:hypothetical protein